MTISDSTGTNTGTVLNDAGLFDVGGNEASTATGSGTLNFSGGTINMTNTTGDAFIVGTSNGATGIVNMSGGILNVVSTPQYIGNSVQATPGERAHST